MEPFSRKPNTACAICAKPIYRRPSTIALNAPGQVFCSVVCRGLRDRKPRTCVVCSTEYLASKNALTCSKACANKNRKGIKYGKGRPKSVEVKIRSLRIRLFEERGTQCEDCGYDNVNVLQMHHIIEKANGGSDDMTNLRLLCPNCHMTIHHGDSRISSGVQNVHRNPDQTTRYDEHKLVS